MLGENLINVTRLVEPVKPKYGDYALLLCCYIQGLLDSACFINFGVFCGMQTGNAVILCLSSARLPHGQPYSYATTAVVITSFFLGAFITQRLGHFCGKSRRLTISLDFLCQSLFLFIAAGLGATDLVPTDNSSLYPVFDDIRIVTILPLLGFQSGATIATSRLLGYNELPVNVLTSTLADLAGDLDLFKKRNIKRNRRLGAVFCFLSGAICGAWILRRGPGIELCLWLSAGLKLAICIALGIVMEEVEVQRPDAEQNASKGQSAVGGKER